MSIPKVVYYVLVFIILFMLGLCIIQDRRDIATIKADIAAIKESLDSGGFEDLNL